MIPFQETGSSSVPALWAHRMNWLPLIAPFCLTCDATQGRCISKVVPYKLTLRPALTTQVAGVPVPVGGLCGAVELEASTCPLLSARWTDV
jgi:hypothetical protein